MKKLNTKGFTIVELAIVVVVIGIIAGVGLYVRERQSNNKVAEAGGYTLFHTASGVRASACRLGTNANSGANLLFVDTGAPAGHSNRRSHARMWGGSTVYAQKDDISATRGGRGVSLDPRRGTTAPSNSKITISTLWTKRGSTYDETTTKSYLTLNHC